MNRRWELVAIAAALGLVGCGGGSTSPVPAHQPLSAQTGTVTLAITDGPMEGVTALVLHVTHVDFGRAGDHVDRMELAGGPIDLDMMQLQNGMTEDLLDRVSMPAGQYEWLRLVIDLDRSHIELGTGAHHGLQMAHADGLRVLLPFEITATQHTEFILDFDLRLGIQRHHGGGMMADHYELHAALRLMYMEDTGGLMGTVDSSLVDLNNSDCDSAAGENWAYLFPADAMQPDDIAETDVDGFGGPVATDRVDLSSATGEYRYHFAFLPEASYRVAFTCAGEWDEIGDDDYPNDPDGRFDFHAFTDPVDVIAGQLWEFDIAP